MKKSEFKQLIKESVREVLITEGFLSTIVAEVVKGIGTNIVVEQKLDNTTPRSASQEKEKFQQIKNQGKAKKLHETKKRMLDAIGKDAYGGIDLFEGTKPITRGGNPGATAEPSSALGDIDPSDPGVDISGFLGGVSNWKQIIK
mgnify:FL=1|tara:strand:+ start:184 stop:615 length:432 start_codon:yes stop_codon:yes gene_type:complete